MKRRDIYTADQWALLFQQGDEKALEFFYDEFFSALALFAFRRLKEKHFANDIVSAAFGKAWRFHSKLNSFQGIRTYLYKIVIRDCNRQNKKQSSLRIVSLDQMQDDVKMDTASSFEQIVRSETYRILYKAIEGLAPGYKQVIRLHYLEGMSTKEIANFLNAPLNTIKAKRFKALRALQKSLLKTFLITFILIANIFLFLR